MRDPRPPDRHRHLQPVDGLPPLGPTSPISWWGRREIDDLVDRFFASPFGMALHDEDRRRLLAEIIDVALRVTGDPTRWDDALATTVLVAELPHQPHVPGRDRRQVPDLLRGFIGFCAAAHGVESWEVDEVLATVAHWSEGWAERQPILYDPWSGERRMLDELRVEVGTAELLWALDADPLPDEPFDLGSLPPEAADAVAAVLALSDRACTALFDRELRTAVRRLAARVVAGQPALLVDEADPARSAAVLVWLVARANGAFGKGRTRVMELMDQLGLRHASPAGLTGPYLRAAGLHEHGHRRQVTVGPELLTSTHRRAIIEQRDHCQRVIGDDASTLDVLHVAHATGRDPRAPSTGQRAAAPRPAR